MSETIPGVGADDFVANLIDRKEPVFTARKPKITAETKQKVLEMLAAKMTYKDISAETGVPVASIGYYRHTCAGQINELAGLNIDGTPKPKPVDEGVRAITVSVDAPHIASTISAPINEPAAPAPSNDYFPGSPAWRRDMLRRLNALIQETVIVLGNLDTDYDGIVFLLEDARLSAFRDMIDWEALAK